MTEEEHLTEARKALKYLVNRIRSYEGGKKEITYGELARQIRYPEPYLGSNFGKRIGRTLGEMGHFFDDIRRYGDIVARQRSSFSLRLQTRQ